MKLIITSLFKALPAVGNVFSVIIALEVVFVILGMQLFSGALGSCSDPSHVSRSACVYPARWANPSYGSFDNFGDGMRLGGQYGDVLLGRVGEGRMRGLVDRDDVQLAHPSVQLVFNVLAAKRGPRGRRARR